MGKMIIRLLITGILIMLSAASLMLMLCFYGEAVAIWPALACAITFILAVVTISGR